MSDAEIIAWLGKNAPRPSRPFKKLAEWTFAFNVDENDTCPSFLYYIEKEMEQERSNKGGKRK
jgi:hypothetical protein